MTLLSLRHKSEEIRCKPEIKHVVGSEDAEATEFDKYDSEYQESEWDEGEIGCCYTHLVSIVLHEE